MRVPASFERVARAAAARPLLVLALVVALAAGGGVLALGLRPSTGTDTLASGSSQAGAATADFHRRFGDDAVVVLVREHLPDLLLTDDLTRLVQLEGCLGGNVPSGRQPYGGARSPCAALAKLKPAQVVYGPGTFLNEAISAVSETLTSAIQTAQADAARAADAASAKARRAGADAAAQRRAADAARRATLQQAADRLQRVALQTGISSSASLDPQEFISAVVFDSARGADVPKAKFAYLFPNANAALIQVRLRSDLTEAQRERAITLIRSAARMPMFSLQQGGDYVVSGVPVVVNDLAHRVTGSVTVLLIGAVVAMALALLLVFRVRPRLLPLLVALAATGLTFGAMALAGVALTMASIAVVPVLIGLAVDYAIQFQSRVEEQRAAGRSGAEAVVRAARAGGPTLATACLATATGFLVLLTSPIPMVQGFGLMLVVGVVLALACALTAGSAALALGERRGRGGGRRAALAMRPPRWARLPGAAGAAGTGRAARAVAAGAGRAARAARAAGGAVAAAVAGAGDILSDARAAAVRRGPRGMADTGRALLDHSLVRPGRVLAVATMLAVAGWAAETQTAVVSDVTKLVPSSMPALRDLDALQRATNSSGEIDVTVTGANVATPAVIRWMTSYQQRILKRFGYDAAKDCRTATLCPAFSLPDLLGSAGSTPTAGSIAALLKAVPPYFSSAVITQHRDAATLSFGIRLMPLDQQQRVIDVMRAELKAPKGVEARLAGLPVVAAQANAELSSAPRRLLTLVAGLVAVGLVLLAALRRADRAFVPLLPIALATGWSALLLYATRVPLNPMSATLGALVIAIATEFSVLLSERFRQERAGGLDVRAALARTYRSTGRAVLASGVTAIAGFAVLMLSDIRMLRDFGLVTVIDLAVALLGVLAVLPSVLVLSERGAFARAFARLRPYRRRARSTPRPGAPAA